MSGPALASPVPANLFMGCSGWAYSSWKPEFYPAKTPAKKMLAYYAARLNSVEVNYTFRKLPSPAIVEGWLAQTGDSFRFSFKAPQRITHFKRLKEPSEVLSAFYASLLPVVRAGRMGMVLFQLPPNFKADLDRLDAFLQEAAPQNVTGLRVAFEFRHASWFSDPVFALMRQHQVALCVAESDTLQTPDVRTAPFACYRLRKSDYGPADMRKLKKQLLAQTMQGEVFAYMKHEETPQGALNAANLLAGLKKKR